MVATIQKIIGKVNPELYAENGKELLKKYGTSENIPAEEVKPKSVEEHTLIYDSSSETLEPLYFFILDLMTDTGFKTEKYSDNFSSAPGSGHFSELQTKASIMQQQASKILADTNAVLRSVLNLTYDLKEFRIRLQVYDDLKNKETSQAARLSLKQLWMDKVDMQKGNSSIKAMALGMTGFQTLIDAFLASDNIQDVHKIDLNERVKRVLLPRIQEFNNWIDHSEKELRKRYELEKTYLRSQANNLKIYARWARPYLQAANDLEMAGRGRKPALVKAFNTILLELTLLGRTTLDVKDFALAKDLPLEFSQEKFLKTLKRKYYNCVLVDFKFRGIPQKLPQQGHYVFGGRADVSFNAYSLNEDEINKINEILEEEDLKGALSLIEGTTESMEQLQEEIDFYLSEESQEEVKKEVKKDTGSNPFKALVGGYNDEGTPKKEKVSTPIEKIIVAKDTWVEKTHIRPLSENVAKEKMFDLFDIYKKAHGMPSFT